MKATFTEVTYFGGRRVEWGEKQIELPFERVTARALIVRRRDGALLAARHTPGACFALLGGGVDDRETPQAALLRELGEEDITLVGLDEGWRERLALDYFDGYRELTLWYLMVVEDASWIPNVELHEIRWLDQAEDLWYPHQHRFILHLLQRFLPEHARVELIPDS